MSLTTQEFLVGTLYISYTLDPFRVSSTLDNLSSVCRAPT